MEVEGKRAVESELGARGGEQGKELTEKADHRMRH